VLEESAPLFGSLTAVLMPEGQRRPLPPVDPRANFDMSLGNGLSKLADKVFRIGHLGDFNDLMLMGTLAGVEMGLDAGRRAHRAGGVQAAIGYLSGRTAPGGRGMPPNNRAGAGIARPRHKPNQGGNPCESTPCRHARRLALASPAMAQT
jgi:hypothetical protein